MCILLYDKFLLDRFKILVLVGKCVFHYIINFSWAALKCFELPKPIILAWMTLSVKFGKRSSGPFRCKALQSNTKTPLETEI